MTRIITISGPQGSGKTTRANKLAEKLRAEGKKVAIVQDEELSPEMRKRFDIIIEEKIS